MWLRKGSSYPHASGEGQPEVAMEHKGLGRKAPRKCRDSDLHTLRAGFSELSLHPFLLDKMKREEEGKRKTELRKGLDTYSVYDLALGCDAGPPLLSFSSARHIY